MFLFPVLFSLLGCLLIFPNTAFAFDPIYMPTEAWKSNHNKINYGSPRFGNTKFEVSNKELTFEIQ